MEPDIVIIGAGAAGIGAAMHLASHGQTPLILEALGRPGGRAWTRIAAGHAIDLGCGYLHSADRNPWTAVAERAGIPIERRGPAWDRQYKNLGAAAVEWQAARAEFAAWSERLAANPPASDIAAEALDPQNPYNAYLQAMSGYINGDELERLSAADYLAYDQASTYENWRLPGGYGALVTSSLPPGAELRLNTALTGLATAGRRLTLETTAGTLRPHAVILTLPSNILAGDNIRLPAALDPWRQAAANLPLGHDEKLFFQILGETVFEPETHVLGDLRDPTTFSFYIRPFGRPIVEVFLGGEGARQAARQGHAASYARALDQLAGLFGNQIRAQLRPLAASDWTNTPSITGAYSHARPGHREARQILAQPYDQRIFFAGEATHPFDFSTAHGAYLTGWRAAAEALAALGGSDAKA